MKARIDEKDFLEYYKSHADEDQGSDPPAIIEPPARRIPFAAVFIALATLFAGLAAAGYILFGTSASTAAVTVRIDGPNEVAAGAESAYTVIIANQSQLPLTDLSLIAAFPEGFSLVSASEEPKNSKKNYWSIDSMRPLETKILAIRGQLNGAQGEKKSLSFAFQYHQKGISAEFEAHGTKDVTLSSSSVSIQVSGPSHARVGEEVTYTIQTAEQGAEQSDSTEIRITPPEGFSVREKLPKPDHDYVWSAKILGTTRTVTLKGSFDGSSAGQTRMLIAAIGVSSGGEFNSFDEKNLDTLITAEEVAGTVLFNGSKESRPLQMGTPVRISLPIENTGDALIADASVSLVITCPILDWLSIENPNGGVIKDGVIRWTDREVPALKLMKKGERAELSLMVRTKPIADIPSSFLAAEKDLSLAATLTVAGTKLAAKTSAVSQEPFSVQPVTLRAPFSSDVQFSASEPSAGTVRWVVTNSLHELSHLRITGKLAAGRVWTDTVRLDAGTVGFDEKNRTIEWSLNRMPKKIQKISVEFDVSGSSTQPILVEQALSAKDAVTTGTISLSAP